jgi:hypothetical protein
VRSKDTGEYQQQEKNKMMAIGVGMTPTESLASVLRPPGLLLHHYLLPGKLKEPVVLIV